jgi:hypothetical protein
MSAASERLRQEAETFDLQKAHADRWFAWRLASAYVGLGLLPVIGGFSIWVIATPEHRSTTVVLWATGVLGTEILGVVVALVRMALNPSASPKLMPVTPAAKRLPRQASGT